ncbi:Meckelin [Chamberlinius hualienensis]
MCDSSMRFDVSKLQCVTCGNGSRSSCLTKDSTGFECKCKAKCKLVSVTPDGIHCEPCPYPQTASMDGRQCVSCHESNPFSSVTGSCQRCSPGKIKVDRHLNGSVGTYKCMSCIPGTQPNEDRTLCIPCIDSLLIGEKSCNCSGSRENINGYCFRKTDLADIPDKTSLYNVKYDYKEQESLHFCKNVRAMSALCRVYSNASACHSLANMCVLLNYRYVNEQPNACTKYVELISQGVSSATAQWPRNGPWLYYMGDSAEETLRKKDLDATYSFKKSDPNHRLNFTAAVYSLDGRYLDLKSLSGGELQFCPATFDILNAAFNFGTFYSRKCVLPARRLWHDYTTVFYDLYLYYEVGTNSVLYAIPVSIKNYVENGNKVNEGLQNEWKLFRRFYLVDNESGKTPCSDPQPLASVIRYAKDIVIRIEMHRSGYEASRIYAPLLTIEYGEVYIDDYLANRNIEVSFTVIYEMDRTKEEMDFSIAVGVLSSLAIIYSAIQTWSWLKRSGKLGIDGVALAKFILFTCGNLATIFLTTTFLTCLYLLIFFKKQDAVYVILPTSQQEQIFIILIVVASFLKLIHVMHVLYIQITTDLFFIDWERPLAKRSIPHPADRDDQRKDEDGDSVSIWRTYLVANEWLELQGQRRSSLGFQILVTVFFLKVVGFENIASADSSSDLKQSEDVYQSPASKTCRIAIGIGIYATVAVIQSLFTFVYERLFDDKIRQFVDLCSISNISVFAMIIKQYGFYIHGRSVHGHADTTMKIMHQQLKREEENLCSQRGLLPNGDHQTFHLALQSKLRSFYDQVMSRIIQSSPITDRLTSVQGLPGMNLALGFEKNVEAYQEMNKFLSSFLEHALRDVDYVVKEKTFMETVLDIEFLEPIDKSIFYQDNGHSYDAALLYGNEFTLTTFDILVFISLDLASQDFVLAGVITFLIGKAIVLLYRILAKRNLAKKTLVDARFLM